MTLAVLAALAVSVAAANPLSVDQAVAATLAHAPELAVARAEVDRADGLQRAECGLRSDPTVQASAALVGDVWSVRATQPLSLTGEGRAACLAARGANAATRARLTRQQLDVAADARRTWVDAVAAAAQVDLAAHALDVARAIEVAARRRHSAGEASQLDLHLAVLTVEEARSSWMAAASVEGHQLQALATDTGVPVERLVLPVDPLVGAPEPGPTLSGDAVRSDLGAARAEVEAARSALARARSGTLSPVAIGAFVEEEDHALRAGPTVTVTLPLWRTQAADRAGAGADLAAAEARAAQTSRQVGAEQAAARRTLVAMEDALRGQPSDVPEQARAALDSVGLGFDRGELDLLSASLLQARILDGHAAWIEGRRLAARARIEAMLATDDPVLLGSLGR